MPSPRFTRRHYIALAEVLAVIRVDGRPVQTPEQLAACLADLFAADNPAFNRAMFLAACGGE